MITEIPTPEDFKDAGLNQLYLAWGIAIQAIEDFEQADSLLVDDDRAEASATYWRKLQPALANALSLIQQAMEMALKGRIAAISPYLLVARDPKDWPRGADSRDVPFSEFRTLDAADLVRVLNSLSPDPLDEAFKTFWEQVRRDRNKVMHSISGEYFDAAALVRSILVVSNTLFSEMGWPRRLLHMEENGSYAAYGWDDYSYNTVLRQVEIALRHLAPRDARDLLDFQPRRRAYVCPKCYESANRDWQEEWPRLAQLQSRDRHAPLRCIVCETVFAVERTLCIDDECRGDVIVNERCVTCLTNQHDPSGFQSGLSDATLGWDHAYDIRFRRDGHEGDWDQKRFPDDAAAREHARLAMLAPHLSPWTKAVVMHDRPVRTQEGGTVQRRIVGTWVRERDQLLWTDGVDDDQPGAGR